MIIGIDGNEANVEKKVGVSVYTLELLRYFSLQAKESLRFIVFLRNAPLSELPKQSKYFTYKVVPGPIFWSQLFLPLALYINRLSQKSISVFFSPAHYAPRISPVPTVVAVHDLSYIFYPQEFLKQDLVKLNNWTKYSISQAISIIAVSKSTKRDLITQYQIPEEKIKVVYNGYEKRGHAHKNPSPNISYMIKRPYILYVGTLQPRKNISMLLKAFQKFNSFYPEYRLVLAGKKGWMFGKIFDEAAAMNISSHIAFTGYVSDADLAYLYSQAFCFVLPSLYEGFGLPVLEAMSYGCPVITSFVSSLPEIGDDACLYFDPASSDNLVEKLLEFKLNKSLQDDLIRKGKKHVLNFSWKKCGKETLDIIKNAALSN